MERPILTLGPKDFLTGIAPSFHTERGGLFGVANGVTPAYDPGGTASVENGLLQAGSSPTDIGTGTVTGTIYAAASGPVNSIMRAFFYDNDGNIYQLLTNGTLSNIRTATNPRAGLAVWSPTASESGLYYFRSSRIGFYNGTSFNDDYLAPTGTTPQHCSPHVLFGDLYFIASGGTFLSKLSAATGSVAVTNNILDWEVNHIATALSDDGVYLVIAVCENQQGADIFSRNRILFWDTNASSWNREYYIRDPFIWSLQRIGNAIIAFGQKGIYEVSFEGGVRKLLSRQIGFGTTTDLTDGFGRYRTDNYNQSAVVFGTDSTIDTFGPLAPDLPGAYYKHFIVPSGVGTPTCVFANFAAGSVYVATDGDKLYRYDFNGSTRETSVSFQTIYIPFTEPTQVHRIDIVFGEPLASGDAFDIDTKVDEDTAAVDFGSASFTADGAIRRKQMIANTSVQVNNQLSIVGNFTGGAPKIKRIEIYGQPLNLGTS